MGQSTATSMTPHERILKYQDLANRSGKRYAWKYEKYEPECQAEARFILTELILERPELLNAAEDEEIFIKIVIARRLRDYYKVRSQQEQVGVHPKHGTFGGHLTDPTDEISIVDEMEALFPRQSNLIALWRKGFDLEEMKFINRHSMSIVEDMIKVKRMLERSRKAFARKLEEAGDAEAA